MLLAEDILASEDKPSDRVLVLNGLTPKSNMFTLSAQIPLVHDDVGLELELNRRLNLRIFLRNDPWELDLDRYRAGGCDRRCPPATLATCPSSR